jgi:hypothetical protein
MFCFNFKDRQLIKRSKCILRNYFKRSPCQRSGKGHYNAAWQGGWQKPAVAKESLTLKASILSYAGNME